MTYQPRYLEDGRQRRRRRPWWAWPALAGLVLAGVAATLALLVGAALLGAAVGG